MCVQFVRMSSKRQYIDYSCSGRKRLSAMKHRIWFQIRFTITGKWTRACMTFPLLILYLTLGKNKSGSTGSITLVSARFPSPSAQPDIPSIYFYLQHAVVVEDISGCAIWAQEPGFILQEITGRKNLDAENRRFVTFLRFFPGVICRFLDVRLCNVFLFRIRYVTDRHICMCYSHGH